MKLEKHRLTRQNSSKAPNNYTKQKLKRINVSMKKVMTANLQSGEDLDDEGEMIMQLKEKFNSTTEKSEKVQVLTVLPKSWPAKRIQSEFGASNYMARKAKNLVKEKGILSTPNPKPGNPLAMHKAHLVSGFYESDEVSRLMPGKKDFVSVKQGDQRIHVQKRLVLSNLKEAYQLFKDKFPDEKIGFSKFAELRPKQCVLAGASGTHTVCVCTIHQNVKLMMLGAKLPQLTAHKSLPLLSYRHCLAQIICNPPQPGCYLGTCASCPGMSKFTDDLVTLMDDNMIDDIVFKQWVSVDRSTLETMSKPVDEFIDLFCDKLNLLLSHSFTAIQQTSFYTECKSALQQGELLITADFSENYAFILQDAAQGFHWNNSQATIHPFVIYYSDSGKLCHLSYIIISNCLHHDTVAVHLFQKKLIAYLKKELASHPQKIYYFSDGAAAQYKNCKNFINLCYHEDDFGISAEWHFYATSHGKNACDGLGGTVKRLAARASLQRPYDEQIMTPRQLFEWAAVNISTVTFNYCSMEEYERQHIFLEERFQNAKTIAGTRKLHSFIPLSKDKVRARYFSSSATFKDISVSLPWRNELTFENVSGFVTCCYNEQWWLACVLQLDADCGTVKVTMLHPCGPSESFKYPRKQHIITLSMSDIMTKVDPRSRTGRVYTLSSNEKTIASEKFNKITSNPSIL